MMYGISSSVYDKVTQILILLHAIVWKQVYKYIWKTASVHSSLLTVRTLLYNHYFFFCGAATQRGSWPPHSWGFLDHTRRRTTVGRTPLDEWSARRRHLYVTTHNTHNRQISMPPVGFEPTISAGERSQTYALDRALLGPAHTPQHRLHFSAQN